MATAEVTGVNRDKSPSTRQMIPSVSTAHHRRLPTLRRSAPRMRRVMPLTMIHMLNT